LTTRGQINERTRREAWGKDDGYKSVLKIKGKTLGGGRISGEGNRNWATGFQKIR